MYYYYYYYDPVFSQRIAAAMEKRNVGVDQLADLAGVSPVTVKRWLRGIYAPRNANLVAVADALGTNESYLNGRDD